MLLDCREAVQLNDNFLCRLRVTKSIFHYVKRAKGRSGEGFLLLKTSKRRGRTATIKFIYFQIQF